MQPAKYLILNSSRTDEICAPLHRENTDSTPCGDCPQRSLLSASNQPALSDRRSQPAHHHPFSPPQPASPIHPPPPPPPHPPPFFLGTTILSGPPSSPTSVPIPPSLESTSLFDPLSDLLLAYPIHSFSLTIILLTILLRTTLTLPAVFWQRDRVLRAKRLVEPEMRRINGDLARSLIGEMKRAGKPYHEYRAELKRQVRSACPSPLCSSLSTRICPCLPS